MAIRTKRFPEYDLNLYVVSGTHTCEEAIRFFEGFGAHDAARALTYFGPTVDISGLDVASLPKLKHTIAAKQAEIFEGRPKPSVVVCSSSTEEAFFNFWGCYAKTGEDRPIAPLLFRTIEAACEWLELPETACDALVEAVKA